MAGGKANSSSVPLAAFLLFMTLVGQSYGQLKVGFYDGKCGNVNVEEIILNVVKEEFQRDKTIVAALLRLQFHDCFVRGCDASILVDGKDTEKMAGPNISVRGYELIDACKAALEEKCPEVVSCADIIAIATRVSVFLAGGEWYDVETGRRDGLASNITDAIDELPSPEIPVKIAIQEFSKRGLTAEDFVLLLGGHTVGVIHCVFLQGRLYNFNNTGKPDPVMDRVALLSLQKTCPHGTQSNNVVAADQSPGSALIVDNGFYKAIVARKGLLEIDQQMAIDPLTKDIVASLASSGDFATKFGPAMVRLGRARVLTGKEGQIRKNCRAIRH